MPIKLASLQAEGTELAAAPSAAFVNHWPGAAALVNSEGFFVWVNDLWRSGDHGREGDSFRACCFAVAGRDPNAARAIQTQFDAVLSGEEPFYRTTFCSGQMIGRRWWQVTIWPVREHGFSGIAVTREDVTAVREAERRASALAELDPLTGLANRRRLERTIDELLALSRARSSPGVFAMIDLDGFKKVNDRYGHDVGDRVLVIVALRLRRGVRSCDTVARIGGDEFALVLHGVDGEVSDRLTSLMAAVRAPIHLDGHNIQIGVSYGWVPIAPESTAPLLYRAADQKMYGMKRARRPSTPPS